MRPPAQAVLVRPGAIVADALREMSRPGRVRTGTIVVTEADGRLAGVFTDGDLRRRVVADASMLGGPISAVMTRSPKSCLGTELLADVYNRIKEQKINELPVVDDAGRVVGLLHVQDVVEWGVAF
jgi:CBS domain-containing protein